MRSIVIGIALALMATAVMAQQPAGDQSAQADKTFTSSAEITALIAKAKSDRKEGQSNVSQRILHIPQYAVSMEYRASVGDAVVHEQEAEIFYVIDGAATMVMGGKLVGEHRLNATNVAGTAIDGGTSQKIAKGDFIIVPENTPRWFSVIDQTLVVMSLHVPRPAVAAKP